MINLVQPNLSNVGNMRKALIPFFNSIQFLSFTVLQGSLSNHTVNTILVPADALHLEPINCSLLWLQSVHLAQHKTLPPPSGQFVADKPRNRGRLCFLVSSCTTLTCSFEVCPQRLIWKKRGLYEEIAPTTFHASSPCLWPTSYGDFASREHNHNRHHFLAVGMGDSWHTICPSSESHKIVGNALVSMR